MDDAKERNVARSIVSFSLNKKAEEPWPPLLLFIEDIMIHLNPDYIVVQPNKHKHDHDNNEQFASPCYDLN